MRELEKLLKQVQETAQSKGHQLGTFNHVDQRTYTAECQRCFGTVIVTPDPRAEESQVEGIPVTSNCPSAS